MGLRVVVMGAGAIGGYYGFLLARRGHDVVFVARGAHLNAMLERGLEVRTGGETHRLRPVAAVADPVEVAGPVDLVLFAVKGYDTEAAAAALRPVVGPETAVLSVQNGVDAADQIAAVLGPGSVLAGVAYVVATVVAPGVIDQVSPFRRIAFGEPDGGITPRVEAIAAALADAGVEVTASPDARAAVWQKFVLQAPHGTITSACRAPVGPIRDTPEGAALYRRAMAEVAAVARASGVALAEDAEATAFAIIASLPPTAKSSIQVDFERGKRVELEQLAGAVVRRGREIGVPTPTFDALYAVLKVRAEVEGIPA